MGEIITKATIAEMVAHRDAAIRLFVSAFAKIAEADAAMKAAFAARHPFQPSQRIGYVDEKVEAIARFANSVKLPDAEEFLATAERLTDIQFWEWMMERGDLARLMDKEAREQLKAQLSITDDRPRSRWEKPVEKTPFPPVTVENVTATVESLMEQSGLIFRRGIANVFSKLDRRFRSHDGFKIGSRVIVDGLMGGDGYVNHYREHFDTIRDIERTFAVLDDIDKPQEQRREQTFRTTEDAIRGEMRRGGPRQFEVETAYFRVRVFKNGNAHLWMLRDNLVEKVNRLLGEYYGEVVGDGRSHDDPLKDFKAPAPARDFDLFPSPPAVVERVIEAADLCRPTSAPSLRVLEPSAGTGALARAAQREGCSVSCVEINLERAKALAGVVNLRQKIWGDFLKVRPDQFEAPFDRVVMNPPFSRERDIDHVVHAFNFLKPGGRLVAVMSAGTEFRETRKSQAFRDLIAQHRGRMEDLPPGSFSSVGTNVNTILVTIDKGAAA